MLEEIAKRMGKVKCEMEKKDMCKVQGLARSPGFSLHYQHAV